MCSCLGGVATVLCKSPLSLLHFVFSADGQTWSTIFCRKAITIAINFAIRYENIFKIVGVRQMVGHNILLSYLS